MSCACAGCMEVGYTDFAQIRTDPDLEFLRQDPRFEVSSTTCGVDQPAMQCMWLRHASGFHREREIVSRLS